MRKKLFKTISSAVLAVMLLISSSIPTSAAAANYPLVDGYANTTSLKGNQSLNPDIYGSQHAFQNFDITKCFIPDDYAECGIPYYEFEGQKYRFYDYTYAIPWVKARNNEGKTANVQFMISWQSIENDGNGSLLDRRLLIDEAARIPTGVPYYAPATTGEGRQILRAFWSWFMDSLAAQGAHVDNMILGNEVNSPKDWHYSGNIGTQATVEKYASAFYDMRKIVRNYSDKTRCSVCVDHTWNYYDGVIGAKEYLRIFHNSLTNLNGGVPVDDWCVSMHLYPCVLFEPAIWADHPPYPSNMNELSENTRWVDGKNLSYVTNYIKNTYGENHRIMLTEQGFSAYRGEDIQAASLAYSYYAAKYDPMVDCFILYTSTPRVPDLDFAISGRKAEDVYLNIDNPNEQTRLANMLLPTIGVSSWSQIIPNFGQTIQRKAYQGSDYTPMYPSGIVLNYLSIELLPGQSHTIAAVLSPLTAIDRTITWSSSDTTVAEVNNGVVTAKSGGTATITATSANGLQAHCTLLVRSYPTGITLNTTEETRLVGDVVALNATLTPADATETAVKWSVNDERIGSVENGLVTLKATGTLIVTAETANGHKAQCTIHVISYPTGITLNTTEETRYAGDAIDLTATITPADATETAIEWTVNNAKIGSVNNGLVTLKAGGKLIVTATTVNGLKAHCTIYSIADQNPDNPFGDVSSVKGWEYPFVKYVYDNSYMTGKGELVPGKLSFDPSGPITREQVAQVLHNIENTPAVDYSEVFSDVPNGKWFTNSVIWAADQGIVSGIGGGKFGTGKNITREQLAIMFYKYAVMKGYDVSDTTDLSSFADSDQVHSWALVEMQWANAAGIINGKSTTTLDPRGSATRAECAAMIKNFMDKYETTEE